MDKMEKVSRLFNNNENADFSPKEVATATELPVTSVYKVLKKLVEDGEIEKVKRGRYKQIDKKPKAITDNLHYLNTIGKTCEIAIHELIIAESLLKDEENTTEIEHQIAYFARYLVKVLWELEQETYKIIDVDKNLFNRAEKIHEWTNMVFEKRKKAK
jgi:sugar-specific transcriptional regulator TrmB